MAEIISLRPTARIYIALHRGVWRVTADGKFYGDYSTKQLAIMAAEEKTLALRLVSRGVALVIASTTGDASTEQVFEPL